MSRAKFEEWARSKGYDLDKWEEEFESFLTVAAHEGWLAGRESMRDEAASLLQSNHEELGLFHYKIAKADIEKIAP